MGAALCMTSPPPPRSLRLGIFARTWRSRPAPWRAVGNSAAPYEISTGTVGKVEVDYRHVHRMLGTWRSLPLASERDLDRATTLRSGSRSSMNASGSRKVSWIVDDHDPDLPVHRTTLSSNPNTEPRRLVCTSARNRGSG